MSYGFQPPPYQQPGALEGHGFQPNAPPFQPNAPPPPYSQAAPGGQCAVIKNLSSGLCVDGTEYDVKLQHYNGGPGQQWLLEPLGGNRYIFRNRANGAVLDIEGGPDCGAHLITYECHGGVNQQWFINPDGTITSAAADVAMDIYEGTCYPGQILIAYDRHGGQNQQFNVQYV